MIPSAASNGSSLGAYFLLTFSFSALRDSAF
jgi:hypothetical protein